METEFITDCIQFLSENWLMIIIHYLGANVLVIIGFLIKEKSVSKHPFYLNLMLLFVGIPLVFFGLGLHVWQMTEVHDNGRA